LRSSILLFLSNSQVKTQDGGEEFKGLSCLRISEPVASGYWWATRMRGISRRKEENFFITLTEAI